jgi:predicted nuclease with TOPRIM domain
MLLLFASLLEAQAPEQPAGREIEWVFVESVFDKIKRKAQAAALKFKNRKLRKRAKAIEVKAAELFISEPNNETKFRDLMRDWANQQPEQIEGFDPLEELFAAQIAFQIQQIRQQIAFEQDEEEAILALLLA